MAQVKFCATCGAEMRRRVRPSGNRESYTKWAARKHCSLKCRTGLDLKCYPERLAKPCAQCGKPTKNYKFCSKRCFGDANIRTPCTEKQGRDQARTLYRHTKQACQHCGATEDLHIHHRDRNPLNNAPENIAIVCHSCHVSIHTAMRRGTQDDGTLRIVFDE